MVVAVVVMAAMQLPVHEVIHVTRMGHRLVTAIDAVLVAVAVRVTTGRASHIGDTVRQVVLVDVPAVDEVQVSVVHVIDVIVMTDRHVPAAGSVIVLVVLVVNEVTHGRHHDFPRSDRRQARSARRLGAAMQSAQRPYNVRSWWVVSKPGGSSVSTVAQPSSS